MRQHYEYKLREVNVPSARRVTSSEIAEGVLNEEAGNGWRLHTIVANAQLTDYVLVLERETVRPLLGHTRDDVRHETTR